MRQRKFSIKRPIREIFLVICEGETEREYVEKLKRHYRLPVTIKTKVSGNKINQRLVAQYMAELGIGRDDDCRVFFIYDADVEEMVEKLSKLSGTLILSNPCIELWYALHVKDYMKSQDSDGMVRSLVASHAVWSKYRKGLLTGDQASFLISRRMDAVARARRLPCRGNPSSNMYLFVEAMEEAKNT
ncbi:MAG: RloB family protein [Bacteroidales bacterium]|nr:RloB family protein [Bacteroidales bacterium]